MDNLIITTPEVLKSVLTDLITDIVRESKKEKEVDSICIDVEVEVLKDNGYTTSKANIYKLTSTNQIPYSKYGSRLVFSRKSLLEWAKKKTVNVTNTTDSLVAVVRSAIR